MYSLPYEMNCILALQMCNGSYMIHGLWFETCQTDVCCFLPETLPSDLIASLESVWVSCKSRHTNQWFWHHEYCKHGKGYFPCAEEYFKAALKAYRYVNTFQVRSDQLRIPLVYTTEKNFEYKVVL